MTPCGLAALLLLLKRDKATHCLPLVLTLYALMSACSAVVGEVDDEIDSQIDFNEMRAVPLKPVAH